jgi:hypothetical protein
MISTKASAVKAPTPGWVLSRRASGHFSASCSIGGLAHAFSAPKSGCPALLSFFARGRGFSLTLRRTTGCTPKLLATTRRPARFNLDHASPVAIGLGKVPGAAHVRSSRRVTSPYCTELRCTEPSVAIRFCSRQTVKPQRILSLTARLKIG